MVNTTKQYLEYMVRATKRIGSSILSNPIMKSIAYTIIMWETISGGISIPQAYASENGASSPNKPPEAISEFDHNQMLETYRQKAFNGARVIIPNKEIKRVLQEKGYSPGVTVQMQKASSTESTGDSVVLVQNSDGSVTNLEGIVSSSASKDILTSGVYATVIINGKVSGDAYSSLEGFVSMTSSDPNTVPLSFFSVIKDSNDQPVCVGSVYTIQWNKDNPDARGGVVLLPPPVPGPFLSVSSQDVNTGNYYVTVKGFDSLPGITAQDPTWLPIDGNIVVEYIGDPNNAYLYAIGTTLFNASNGYEQGKVLKSNDVTISGSPGSFLGPCGKLYVEASDNVANINRTGTVNFSDYTLFAKFYGQQATPAQVLTQGTGALQADVDNDGTIGTGDLREIANNWLGEVVYIDFKKFSELAGNWGKSQSEGDAHFRKVDFERNCKIDWGDLEVLAGNWLETVYFPIQ